MTQKDIKKEAPASADDIIMEDEAHWGDFMKTAALAIFVAILLRTFLYEPFNIPSGSMKPTLLVGDYLFVSKPAYGYSKYSFPLDLPRYSGRIMGDEPKRGDVAVFRLPSNTKIDYIKRIIGMPGDTIQMINGRLFLNGEIVPRKEIGTVAEKDPYGGDITVTEYIETLPGGVEHKIWEISDDQWLDNTPKFTVPQGHYFFMGDNRDNSRDSRVIDEVGYVKFENLIGRAQILFFSTDGSAKFHEFWKWPFATRYSRLLNTIGPDRNDENE